VLLVVFVALGAGSALGLAAQVFGPQFAPGATPDPEQAEQLVDLFRDAAWQTLFAMILAVAASILGALLATRDEIRTRIPRLTWH
jgi:ABC-type Fe3+ transport system permease subunit